MTRTVWRACAGVAALVACFGVGVPPARACSTFCLGAGDCLVFGKNYDWSFGDGMLVVNPRGAAKRAQPTAHGQAAQWTSRFGSLTFDQYGREFPSGGINEAGLVIELMWHEAGRYAGADARPTLGCLQWIQYQLDTAATVDDVVSSDARVRIDSPVPLHFLVADRGGHVAAVEFLDGRLVAYTGDRLPVAALTNNSYADSLAYSRELESSRAGPPAGPASLARFDRAARSVRAYGTDARRAADAVAYAFETLAGLAQPGRTQWSIVYEPAARRVHFQTRENPETRTVRLAALDFGCGAAGRALDLASAGSGDVTRALQPYSAEANLALIRRSFAKTSFLAAAGEEAVELQAAYPRTVACGD